MACIVSGGGANGSAAVWNRGGRIDVADTGLVLVFWIYCRGIGGLVGWVVGFFC